MNEYRMNIEAKLEVKNFENLVFLYTNRIESK